MATSLVIRGLDEGIVEAIEVKAKQEGVSREEWARRVLAASLDRSQLISDAVRQLWASLDKSDNWDEFGALSSLIGSVAAEGIEDALCKIRGPSSVD